MKIFQAAAVLLAMFASLAYAAPERKYLLKLGNIIIINTKYLLFIAGTVLIQTDNTQYIRTG
ncbi:hypothetical protein KR032_008656 [Drosophila birchii]|nr:hypothetical protein KR032_008656 [Drosophila birchii]